MARREHKSVAIDPPRTLGVMLQGMAIEHCTNFSGTERQTEMARLGGMNGIHGESTGLIGSFGEKEGLEGHVGLESYDGAAMGTGEQYSFPGIKKRAQEGSP